jgi:hypothetical protein
MQMAVAFQTKRVKSLDEDDWRKLKRVLVNSLNGTKYLKLTMSVQDPGILKLYVTDHYVFWDCKSRGGAMFALWKGAVLSYSQKMKLNTRSSTETELVLAGMYMPEMLWSLYFIQSQGYNVECVKLCQDNTSTQLTMRN